MIAPAFDYINPDYKAVIVKRAERLAKLRGDPALLAGCKAYYKHNIAHFINDWGVTVNPKNAGTHRPVVMPFVLFPKQHEFVDWCVARWLRHENGVLVKSRECGASWLAMATSASLCLFWNDLNIGFGSAKEEFVDSLGDPNCLFYKGRKFVEGLPREFKGDWNVKQHSSRMKLLFPGTGSTIVGGAGDNIGVGGRSSLFFIDEYAVIERPKLIETNLSANTDTRIEMSTVRGLDNVFAEHARGGLIPRFDFSYVDDPTKVDPATGKMTKQFADHVADMDPTIFNQEYGCDFLASIEGGVIDPKHVTAALDAAAILGIVPTGTRQASLDIADLGKDKNAMTVRHGVELEYAEEWSGNNSNPMETIRRAFDICDRYHADVLIYDASGMGGSWHEYFAIANAERETRRAKPIRVQKFQGGGAVADPDLRAPGTDRLNKDYFENAKAQSHMMLRMRFVETYKAINGEKYDPEAIISIPKALALRDRITTELCQPVRKWSKNGKLMIDKTPDGVASPNISDSIVQNFGYLRPPLSFSDELLAAL